MFEPRVLKNPPIVEAIYTITFKDPVDISQLKTFINTPFIRESFPDIREGFAFQVTEDMATPRSREGFSLGQSTDLKKRRIQVRRTYLSFHNLNTYDGWDVMIEELKELWGEFCKSVTNVDIKEVRVRNINAISIPFENQERNIDMSDYLTVLPTVPIGIDPNLNGFFIQIKTAEPAKKFEAAVTVSTLTVDNSINKAAMSLDIHVLGKMNPLKGNEQIWETFNQLREYKDYLFFQVVTDESLKLFDK